MCNYFCLYAKGSYCVGAVRSYLIKHASDNGVCYKLASVAKPPGFPLEFKKNGFALRPGVVYVAVCCFAGDYAVLDVGKVFLSGCSVFDHFYSQSRETEEYFKNELRMLRGVKRPRLVSSVEQARFSSASWMDNASRSEYSKFGRLPVSVANRSYGSYSVVHPNVKDEFWDKDPDFIEEYIMDEIVLYRLWKKKGGLSGTGTAKPAEHLFWLLYEALKKSCESKFPYFVPSFELVKEMHSFFFYFYSDRWLVMDVVMTLDRWFGSGEWPDELDRSCCGL